MVGGLGDDTYIIESFSDVVYEKPSEGADTLWTSVSRSLELRTSCCPAPPRMPAATAKAISSPAMSATTTSMVAGGLGQPVRP
ncbi:hypothetical protein GCM10028812_52950 [Ancylobacter sonchi]